jgi:hypothetical protein
LRTVPAARAGSRCAPSSPTTTSPGGSSPPSTTTRAPPTIDTAVLYEPALA